MFVGNAKASNSQVSTGFSSIRIFYIGVTDIEKEAILSIDGISFSVVEMIAKRHLKITDPQLINELNTAFKFQSSTRGQLILLSKPDLRKKV